MAGPLPTELLANVFGYLPPSYLAIVSRVSHTWRKAAFPPLYQTVYLCLGAHLQRLIERIRTEDVASQFSITNHLKGLVLDIKYIDDREEEMINELDLGGLNAIIPRLTHLKYLSWNLMFVPEDPKTFRLFQTGCPKLDSVHIWIQDEIDFYSDQYKSYVQQFDELTASGFDEHQLAPLSSLLARCPRISSIILDLNSGDGESQYSPTALVASLDDQCVFPHLRRFNALGTVDPGWTEFFEEPESHPFRQFFARHPRIEDLALGYIEETGYDDDIDPTEVAQLFPSLKHFEGPLFLLIPLILSNLSEQVEKLVIIDDPLRDDEVPVSKIYDGVPNLPKLRNFSIWAGVTEEDILINLLRTIVNAASQLEEIEIHQDIDADSYEEVMKLITQVPSLRSLTLSESILSSAAEYDGEEDSELEWVDLALKLRIKLPRLRTIYQPIRDFGGENREKVWGLSDSA